MHFARSSKFGSRPVLRRALFLAAFGLALSSSAWASDRSPALAPAFRLPTRDSIVSLDSLRGRTVYVDFWASWCGPCRASFPWMKSLHERYAGKGLVVLAINVDKEREAADAFLSKYPAPFTVAFDPEGKTAESFHVAAMPSSFLVDGEGKIVMTHRGFDPKKTKELEERIREALEE